MNYQGSTNKISATNAFSRCYIVDKEQLLLQQTLPRGSSVMKQNSHEIGRLAVTCQFQVDGGVADSGNCEFKNSGQLLCWDSKLSVTSV